MKPFDWKRFHLYFTAPLVIVMPMIFMYFSGNEALQRLISPYIDGLYGNSNRELGLLENLQNVALIAILVFLVRAFWREKERKFRIALVPVVLVATFVLVEELDYGLHYYEYFSGVTGNEAVQERNWHNVGDRTSTTKTFVDIGMVLMFLVAPLVLYGSSFPIVRQLTPDSYAWLTLVVMVIVRSTAHGLQDAGFGDPGTMDSNLSEFREFVTYYLGLVYVGTVFNRRYPNPPQTEASSPPATAEAV